MSMETNTLPSVCTNRTTVADSKLYTPESTHARYEEQVLGQEQMQRENQAHFSKAFPRVLKPLAERGTKDTTAGSRGRLLRTRMRGCEESNTKWQVICLSALVIRTHTELMDTKTMYVGDPKNGRSCLFVTC